MNPQFLVLPIAIRITIVSPLPRRRLQPAYPLPFLHTTIIHHGTPLLKSTPMDSYQISIIAHRGNGNILPTFVGNMVHDRNIIHVISYPYPWKYDRYPEMEIVYSIASRRVCFTRRTMGCIYPWIVMNGYWNYDVNH